MKSKDTIVKVFSATMARDRDSLGERVTAWLHDNPAIEIQELRTLQSSDSEFHCLTIVLIGRNEKGS